MVREHTVQYRTHKWTVSETNTHPAPPAALQKCIRRSSNSYISARVHYGPDNADVYVSVLWEKMQTERREKRRGSECVLLPPSQRSMGVSFSFGLLPGPQCQHLTAWHSLSWIVLLLNCTSITLLRWSGTGFLGTPHRLTAARCCTPGI